MQNPGRFKTRNRKRLLMAAVAVVVAVGVAGIALAINNTDDDQIPSTPAVATVAPTTIVAPDLSAGTPGLVTGHLRDKETTPPAAGPMWQEDVAVDGGFRQRVRESHATSEMSDARLSGSVTVTDNADRFGYTVADEFVGDVLWGTIVIENDQGTWTGPLTGTGDLSADIGVFYYELVGAGAYEGLSAIIFERETGTSDSDWNGVIFSGNLPPDR